MDTRAESLAGPAAEAFWRDGVVVVPGFFGPAELSEVERELARYIDEVVPTLPKGDVYHEDPPSRAIKSMFRMQRAPYFEALGRHPLLITLMGAIFTEGDLHCDDVGFFGKAARDGSVTPAHQDNAFNHFNPPWCLKASLALDPATTQNGAMVCQKGSHTIGVLPHRPSGVMGFSQTLIEELDPRKYPEVSCNMLPGDLTLHHTNTVHRSPANHSDQSRRMLSFIYRSSKAVRDEQAYQAYKRELGKLHTASR